MPSAGQLGRWLGDLASLFQSSLGSSSSYDSEMPSSQEASSVAWRASCPRDAHQGDPCDRDGASSGVVSLPPAKCLHQESPGPRRPHSAPLLATSGLSDPELSAELDSLDTQEAQALKSILAQRSKLSEVMRESGACTDGRFLEPQFPPDRCTHGQPPFQGEAPGRYRESNPAQPKCLISCGH